LGKPTQSEANNQIRLDHPYNTIEGDLKSLKTRLANSPNFETQGLVPNVDDMITLFDNMSKTQMATGFNYPYVYTQDQLFNEEMGVLQTYELSLKGGSSPSSAASTAKAKSSTAPAAPPKPAT
jgi:hypothetical protein